MNKIINDIPFLTYDDVLIRPGYSEIESRSDINLPTGIIYSSNMDTITEDTMALFMDREEEHGVFHRNYPLEKSLKWNIRNRHISVGSIYNDKQKIYQLIDYINNNQVNKLSIWIEMANAYSKHGLKTVEFLRERTIFPIILGNVCTKEACFAAYNAGATMVKVGIGPGSACTTRIKTGCGYPQLSAILECVTANVPIIADGGIRTPGDVAKALAAGAAGVMIGGMLAGTDWTPGWHEGGYQEFRGMASGPAKKSAMKDERDIEGISTSVKCKEPGSSLKVINDIREGVRSAMSYVGASTLEEFRKKAKFIRVTPATQRENHPHILA